MTEQEPPREKPFKGLDQDRANEIKKNFADSLHEKGKLGEGTSFQSVGLTVLTGDHSREYGILVRLRNVVDPKQIQSFPQEVDGLKIVYKPPPGRITPL